MPKHIQRFTVPVVIQTRQVIGPDGVRGMQVALSFIEEERHEDGSVISRGPEVETLVTDELSDQDRKSLQSILERMIQKWKSKRYGG